MSAQLDESTKAPLSERVRGWMWKGMVTAENGNGNGNGKVKAKAGENGHAETESSNGNGHVEPSAELDTAMRTHLQNMAVHAGGIQRAASADAVRVRTGALDTATRVLEQVDKLEAELKSMEVAYGEILRAIHSELSDARTMLANERTAAQQANAAIS